MMWLYAFFLKECTVLYYFCRYPGPYPPSNPNVDWSFLLPFFQPPSPNKIVRVRGRGLLMLSPARWFWTKRLLCDDSLLYSLVLALALALTLKIRTLTLTPPLYGKPWNAVFDRQLIHPPTSKLATRVGQQALPPFGRWLFLCSVYPIPNIFLLLSPSLTFIPPKLWPSPSTWPLRASLGWCHTQTHTYRRSLWVGGFLFCTTKKASAAA